VDKVQKVKNFRCILCKQAVNPPPTQWHSFLIALRRFASAENLKGYARGSVATGRVSAAKHAEGWMPDEEVHFGPLGLGL
jgi:hypothetical protein